MFYRTNDRGGPELAWRKEPDDNQFMGYGRNLDNLTCGDCNALIGRLFFTHECPQQTQRLAELAMQMIAEGIVK